MCGITGWVDWQRDLALESPTTTAMTETMRLRGPDAGGSWTCAHAFLGHRRLAIIDIDGGAQPMADGHEPEDTQVVITYSGEVYNFRELRAELIRAGHTFRTRSDTEVVLEGYKRWGPAVAERLNGMFAFAVWDARAQRLVLVRDRLGIKPLYYHHYDGGLLFGSEPKAILANPLFPAELDTTGIAELFVVATAPTPGNGVFRGLSQVEPGHVVAFDRQGLRSTAYWSLSAVEHHDDADTAAGKVRELLTDIVERQLVADVSIGTLLSGGLDSSAITAIAAHLRRDQGHDKIASYSVDFPGSSQSFQSTTWHPTRDQPYATAVSAHVGTQHTTVLVEPTDVLTHEAKVLRARDLPGWGEMDVSLYLLFDQVKNFSTVALSGESADEIFGGYPYFTSPQAREFDGFPWLAGKTGPSVLLREEIREAVDPVGYARARYEAAVAAAPRLDGESTEDAVSRRISYLALTRWIGALLDRKDRISMATGLEVRVPFCDHRLIEYVWNVPWEIKTVGGQEKGLLRRAVADLLPQEVLERRKSGFPPNPDPNYLAAVQNRVAGLLSTPDARVFDVIDRDKASAWLAENGTLPSPRAASTTTAGLSFLLNLDSWLTDYGVRVR
ncbi:asparagine synthase (glutamine-hydrolyzing) [Mycobacteroides saopaulense]|uniref:asparagine synthase (glutamine-hydrolyzing) n=1 Tax=Mycobacteroides saopaulense TaxID=1578165 RepID=A0ABX3C5Y3_9MYCO|nr:asparagine synthase (glutamine-hydrolyzing) [Mycobacteroides saopaulense]OHT89020.1 asparagine synthase (glutamine-hydrolyzing) [Mycobacteroides saopaulense]OHU13840.1 asparagine synthase (glutamine-hydrolyzing) [Mycobacteroides saopaulense]